MELDLGRTVRTARLRLDGLRPPFLKRYRLEGSGDRRHWSGLVARGTLFDLPAEGLRLLTADFPEGEYRYLRLVWDDRSSAPLAAPRGGWAQGPGGAPAPVLVPLAFEPEPAEPGVSRFALPLPGPGLPVRALVLDVAGAGPLLRTASVTEPRLQGAGLAPRLLGEAGLRRAQRNDVSATDLRIPLDAPEGSELDLRVLDGNNPPLVLAGVQAELAPQPWIYFETAGPGPVTALCGDRGLAPPHYDLEALRDRLDPAGGAAARWGPASPVPPGSADLARLDPGPGPVLEPTGFRFRRPVPQGPPGLAALVLDPHVLAHSPRLADLRLLDRERRQIPYLLEQRDAPLGLDLALGPARVPGPASSYSLVLPQAGLPPARLVLETSARVFSRRVLVREDTATGALELAAGTWTHQDPETPAQPLELLLPPLAGARLVLEVAEGDNQPLPLKAARLLLPGWRIRYFQPAGPVDLCYGQDLPAPQYDLALLAGRLLEAPAREVSLGAAAADPGPERALGPTGLYWTALGVAVAGLLVLLGRLLKQSGSA